MTENDLKIKLTENSGDEFFDALEKLLQSKIPLTLKNVLKFNRYDSASALSECDEDSIEEIENCMRNVFDKEMIDVGETVADYLGVFAKFQTKFILLSGELKLIKRMAKNCQSLYALKPAPAQVDFPSPEIDESDIATGRSVPDDTSMNLFNTICAHLITIYNDAQRTTLSGWSWPSRYVASVMANNFRLSRSSLSDNNLQYVTPTCHKEFTDCIVKSDFENFKVCIRESLAMSLRADGSVDRTEKHNVFVMVQIVKKDESIGTLCLGFEVPQTPGAAGYLNCLQNVVNKVMPWDDFFELITSIVTDGESLNMGHLNGLIAKLTDLRNQSNLHHLPLLSIWCVAHRINLGWKSVSKINVIANLITRARKLSKYFHDSGKRTGKLNTISALKCLETSLRYPSFFAVRWVEFVYNLFYAILRNWRASIFYFKEENLQNKLKQWTQYQELHCIAFLTNVLGVLKIFQKSCHSDSITLIDVSRLSDTLFEELENFKVGPIKEGWEELFFKEVVSNGNKKLLHGIELNTTSTSRTRRIGISFNTIKRQQIIQSLIQHLKMRLSLDASLLMALKPLSEISSSTSRDNLKLCHRTIAADLDEHCFISEYYTASELLKDCECGSTLETLRKLISISPDQLHTLKVALARICALKPHSADVERLIHVYNKFKEPDRASLSQETLSNYLYINTNMGVLEDFDPKPAAQCWLGNKKRHPKTNNKATQQEWFNGVFKQAVNIQKTKKPIRSKIQF